MPRIGLITPVYHSSLHPYHVDYDNLPLRNIIERQNLINNALDNVEEIIQAAQGTQGSVDNRISQSLDEDGNLRTDAIDESLHNIGAHEDGQYDGIDYVRMKADERAKLEEISDDATALRITFETLSTTVEFEDDTIIFQDTDTISWTVEAPNVVKANTAFPNSAAHEHHYDIVPDHQTPSTPNYTNYEAPVVFIEGSLRVYVNGIRIPEASSGSTYVYNAATGPSGSWALTNFTATPSTGEFVLNRALSSSDVILIDFDRSFI